VSSKATTSNAGLLIERPLQIFWTAYDPLDLASGSLDPLGFARGYLALANRFLPSFTTVTTVPRYASMLCAALKAAQTHNRYESEIATSKEREERLRLVKSFERAWALACGLTAREGTTGTEAVAGLRGVRYVNRRLEALSTRDKYIQTRSFNLLSNQVRYGGIGIYSTFLEECHLASMNSLTLRPLGEALAIGFPAPPQGTLVYDENARLSLDALKEWGSRAQVGSFTPEEGAVMAQALRGGEEADQPDQIRWAALRMLAKANPKPGYDEGAILRGLAKDIRNGRFDDLGAPAACITQIDETFRLLEPFEQFYQGVTFLFERIRSAASDEVEARLTDMAKTASLTEAVEAIRKSADELRRSLMIACQVNATTARDVETVLRESGILSLVDDVLREPTDTPKLMRIVLQRHSQVQTGKFDRGLPKTAWARLTDTGDHVRLTAQRYQLSQSQRPATWKDVDRHPYRTGSAFAFIRACNMNIW
jgi:hypothetical protein